jgi:hypothetical protein
MRSLTGWFAVIVALTVLVVGPVLAAEEVKEAAKAEPAKTEAKAPAAPAAEAKKSDQPAATGADVNPITDSELEAMIRECGLSEAQQAKLRSAAEAYRAEAQAWEKANADKIAAAQKAIDAARLARDRNAYIKALTDAIPLRQQQFELGEKFQKSVLEILTPDQQVSWEGYLLWQEMSQWLDRMKPTPEQTAKLRPLCNATAKDLLAVKTEDEEGVKARQAIGQKLLETVKTQVLTEEQRKMLETPTVLGGQPAAKPPAPIVVTGAEPTLWSWLPDVTPEQAAKFVEVLKPAQQAMDKWWEAARPKLDAYHKAMSEVQNASDKEFADLRKEKTWPWVLDDPEGGRPLSKHMPDVLKAIEAVQPAVAEYAAIRRQREQAILNLLTVAQKAVWREQAATFVSEPLGQACRLEQLRSNARISLTDAQRQRMAQTLRSTARKWLETRATGAERVRARRDLEESFRQTLQKDVFSPEQTEAAALEGLWHNERLDLFEGGDGRFVVEACKLTDRQKADLKAKLEARDSCLAPWADSLEAFGEGCLLDLQPGRDAEVIDVAQQAARMIRAQACIEILLNVLTPEQRHQWYVYAWSMDRVHFAHPPRRLTDAETARLQGIVADFMDQLAKGPHDGAFDADLLSKTNQAYLEFFQAIKKEPAAKAQEKPAEKPADKPAEKPVDKL